MKIASIVGARPNFMKIAPILRALGEYSHVESCLIHTGQHYDKSLSDVFFEELDIPRPDISSGYWFRQSRKTDCRNPDRDRGSFGQRVCRRDKVLIGWWWSAM